MRDFFSRKSLLLFWYSRIITNIFYLRRVSLNSLAVRYSLLSLASCIHSAFNSLATSNALKAFRLFISYANIYYAFHEMLKRDFYDINSTATPKVRQPTFD